MEFAERVGEVIVLVLNCAVSPGTGAPPGVQLPGEFQLLSAGGLFHVRITAKDSWIMRGLIIIANVPSHRTPLDLRRKVLFFFRNALLISSLPLFI